MELYIFDRDLNFKGILDNFTSLRWVRRYFKSGEFELHCPLTKDSLELLKKDNIIYKKGDTEAAYIEFRNFKQDTNGEELLKITGKFLTSYLNRRIIWNTEVLNTTVEIAMRTLISNNCIDTKDKNRIIDNLILGNLNNFVQVINYQVSYKNLADEIESLSNLSNLGYRVNLDIKKRKFVFDIYNGLDRSINQSINPRAIFSKEFENILEQEYTESINNYRNVTLVAGAGEGIERKFISIGDYKGLDRFELFTDARDIQDTREENGNKVSLTKEEYAQNLMQRGNENLSSYQEIYTFDSKINSRSNLKYKMDFDLGDIVTCVSKKWGIKVATRITEVEEIYEQNGVDINIVFGNNIPTLIDKLKQKLR